MPFNIGAPELIIILVIALLILGPGKLPEVGSALGRSIREFRKASTDIQDSIKLDTTTPQSVPPPPQPNQISQPVAPNTLSQPAPSEATTTEAQRS